MYHGLNSSSLNHINLIFAAICIIFASTSYASEKELIGKWYAQPPSKDIIELFEDKDLIWTDKNSSYTGTWTKLSDGRLKLKVDLHLGKIIALGNLNNNKLRLTYNNKTLIFMRKTSSSHSTAQATKQDSPNPTEKQKRDPKYSWSSPYDGSFKGITSLHLAIVDGDLKLVKELIKKGADINAKATTNEPHKNKRLTPLDFAYGATEINQPYKVTQENEDLVAYLESKGALMGTIKLPKLQKIQANTKNGYLSEDLYQAIYDNNAKEVMKLLERGADINNKDGDFPHLYNSLGRSNNLEHEPLLITRILLAAGADPNQSTPGGPLLLQVTTNYEAACLLLSYGADVNGKLSEKTKKQFPGVGETPLDYALYIKNQFKAKAAAETNMTTTQIEKIETMFKDLDKVINLLKKNGGKTS